MSDPIDILAELFGEFRHPEPTSFPYRVVNGFECVSTRDNSGIIGLKFSREAGIAQLCYWASPGEVGDERKARLFGEALAWKVKSVGQVFAKFPRWQTKGLEFTCPALDIVLRARELMNRPDPVQVPEPLFAASGRG